MCVCVCVCVSMAWKHPGSPSFKKLKTSTSSRKQMATVFWDMHGVFLLRFTPPPHETVNSAAYQVTLKKLKRAVQRKRPQMSNKRVLLLHDNARPHTAHATMNLLEQWAGKFFSTRPTARIWHLRTFISSSTWKNIFVPSDSKHLMMSSFRCKRGFVVRILPSIDRVLRNRFST